jgi:hypothetical protein
MRGRIDAAPERRYSGTGSTVSARPCSGGLPVDADRFEALLRSFAPIPSRRATLRLLAGSAFGSFFTRGGGDAAAHNALKKCKKIRDKAKRKKCVKKAKAHNAQHRTAPASPPPFCAVNPESTPCGAGGTNQCCGGVCVDTASDATHCGGCGQPCPLDRPTCCDGECVNTSGDPAHCFGCGNACLPGDICGGQGSCCTPIYASCQQTADRCCGASICSGINSQGQQVCCGISNLTSCSQCSFNSACSACCSGLCGGSPSNRECVDCRPFGQSCLQPNPNALGCAPDPSQPCPVCCSQQCGSDGTCCKPAGVKCNAGSECCSGQCQAGPAFAACT